MIDDDVEPDPSPLYTMCDRCGTVSREFLSDNCVYAGCPSNRINGGG